jgi:hypothetical protein
MDPDKRRDVGMHLPLIEDDKFFVADQGPITGYLKFAV